MFAAAMGSLRRHSTSTRPSSAGDARRLKSLEDENRRLKKLLAEQMLDNAILKDVASKKWYRPMRSATLFCMCRRPSRSASDGRARSLPWTGRVPGIGASVPMTVIFVRISGPLRRNGAGSATAGSMSCCNGRG